MKTNGIVALTIAALMLATSGSLWASTPGKHVGGSVPHKHGTPGVTKTETGALKHVGPPGKSFTRRLSNKQR